MNKNHISGFNLRKEKKKEKDAAELIQRNFRGYRRRKQIGFSDTVDVIHAAIRIQKVYRGFQARKKFQAVFKHRIEEDPDSAGSDLPDLNDADVAAATVKIQTAYRGFATRKQLRQVRFHKFFFSINWCWYVESARWVSTNSSKTETGKIELFNKISCENDVGYYFSKIE